MSYTPLPVLASAPVDHAAAAATFTADDERTDWHDGALWHVREKRDRAVAQVPEWEASARDGLRRQGAHARPHWPTTWSSSRPRRPPTASMVHWARDAAEHNGSSATSWAGPARRAW